MTSLILLLGCPQPEPDATDDSAVALPEIVQDAQQGDPGVSSAYRIAFGPQGWLAIGDGDNDRIVVANMPDEDAIDGDFAAIADLVDAIADATGSSANSVEVLDVTVNPETRRTYVAAEAGGGHVLLRVEEDRSLSSVDLSDVEYVSLAYPTVGDVGSAVSDLTWTESHLVAAVTEWTWTESQVVTVARPLVHDDTVGVASTSTYHRTHGAWETTAPITTLFAYEDGDASWIGASYQCAPVVRFDVNVLAAGGEVVGETPFDYGGGRQVLDFEVQGTSILGAVYGLGDGSGWDSIAGTAVDADYFFASEIDEDATIAFNRSGEEKYDYALLEAELDDVYRFGVIDDARVVVYELNGGLEVVAR